MASKKEPNSTKKYDSSRRQQANDSSEDLAMLIKQTMATEMETLQETVADMLKDALEKALDPIEKHMIENGNILRSLKEQSDSHAKKISTVFSKIDNIQASLRKNEKDTSSCLTEMTNLHKKLTDLEDRSRRNNVRPVNLPTGVEGDDPRGYLQRMLPIWIPSLGGSTAVKPALTSKTLVILAPTCFVVRIYSRDYGMAALRTDFKRKETQSACLFLCLLIN